MQGQKLRDVINKVKVGLEKISETNARIKPSPYKWSKKEILGHLVDSAVYNLERFTKIRFAAQPLEIQPFPQDDLVKANNYLHAEINDLLNLWTSLN